MKNRPLIFAFRSVIAPLIILFSVSCIKEPENVPVLETSDLSDISFTTAFGGGNVTSDGGSAVTERGVCWSTIPDPCIEDRRTSNGTGGGNFFCYMTGLEANTTYYVKAYATNSTGTGYGNLKSFITQKPTMPVIRTFFVSNIAITTSICGGDITSDGGAPVTGRGVCWSTLRGPTISDSHTTDGYGSGAFTSNIKYLTAGTPYYIRAYATNTNGTAYGEEKLFITYNEDAISDYDENYYNVVTIGSQVWMRENLKTTHYNDGTAIPNVKDAILWSGLTTGAYCWYGNDSNEKTYGILYNSYAIKDPHDLCPTGWHIPTLSEIQTLEKFLGQDGYAGGKLKETGMNHWASPNYGADNSTGFTALPNGWRTPTGGFDLLGKYASGWLFNAENTAGWGTFYYLRNTHDDISIMNTSANYGCSVRCIKDK